MRLRSAEIEWAIGPTAAGWSVLTLLFGALLLGGGTHEGFIGDALLQLIAVPILLTTVGRRWQSARVDPMRPAEVKQPYVLAACVAGIPLLQLIPLPVDVWHTLPGREMVSSVAGMLDPTTTWHALSISPRATVLALLALIPPIAVFLATTQLAMAERRTAATLIVACAVASVAVGLLQLVQGTDSSLRPFAITNPTDGVGLFANRNHLAALLYCGFVYAVALLIQRAASEQNRDASATSSDISLVTRTILPFTVVVILIAGQIMTRSRAGTALLMVAVIASLVLAMSMRSHLGGFKRQQQLIASALTFSIVFVAQFALYRLLQRFGGDAAEDARAIFSRQTLDVALTFLPFGAGFGTFVPTYAMYEPAQSALGVFANRAHNDLLEVLLESGLVGLLAMGAFAVWYAARACAAWQLRTRGAASDAANGDPAGDDVLARASTIVIALLIAHSGVDYPLRTGAMLCIFAFACGLLVPAADDSKMIRPARSRAKARRTHAPKEDCIPIATPTSATVQSSWIEQTRWPDAWRPDRPEPDDKARR